MALTFDICQLRASSYSASSNNSGGHKSCSITITTSYLVKVTDPADPNFNGSKVTDLHVAFAQGIPVVNLHTFYDSITGVGMPLAICSDKKVKRLDNNAATFQVDVTYKTEPAQGNGPKQEKQSVSQTAPSPPPSSPEEIPPQESRSVVGRDIVLYSAPAYTSNETAMGTISTTIIPSANDLIKDEFNQPVTRKQANLQLTITQFEGNFTDVDLVNRCYKVNLAEYRGFPAKSCMITSINCVDQIIQTDTGEETWNRVTYTILVDEYTVENQAGPLFVGHAAALPLISHYHTQGDQLNEFWKDEESGLGGVGLIDSTGAPLANQSGSPDYIRFDTVDELDFSFLQL